MEKTEGKGSVFPTTYDATIFCLFSLDLIETPSALTCPLSRFPCLVDRLKQHDAGGHRHIQAVEAPRIGIETSRSHRSRTSRRRPVPSAPRTTAVGSVQSICVVLVRSRRPRGRSSRPPAFSIRRSRGRYSLRWRSARARPLPRMPWRRYRRATRHVAPACTTPCAPAASTVRRIAPTLCGSSMPSSTTSSGAAGAAARPARAANNRAAARARRRFPGARRRVSSIDGDGIDALDRHPVSLARAPALLRSAGRVAVPRGCVARGPHAVLREQH